MPLFDKVFIKFKMPKWVTFIFLTVLPVFIPIIVFFTFNMLTPVWWDDFIMSCFFTEWQVPHTALLSSFSDVITSTYNIYQTWHGRSVADFINFLFMFFKNKIIFNVFNTIVYCIFVLLIGFHVTGSFRKISALFFLSINILLWLLISAWGQTLLWLTGSCNYLWTSTIILLFLVPFRKKVENLSYRPHIIISFLWIIMGILAGWSMENSASGIFILLLAYFTWKILKREPVLVFEVSGSIGFLFGFFMLIRARDNLFPGFWGLVKNTVKVGFSFINNDALLITVIFLLAIELIFFRKTQIDKTTYGFFIAALGSVAAMILPGSYGGRSAFLTQVFLIITLLLLVIQIKQIIPRRYIIMTRIAILMCFLSSFYSGSKDIVKGFLYAESRERYILSEKENGNLAVKAKSPISISDPHSGMYGGTDILYDPADREYIAHNSAKVVWYEIESLDGIPILKPNEKGITGSIKKFLSHRKSDGLSINDLFTIIYEEW
jgi:hypothetical protein